MQMAAWLISGVSGKRNSFQSKLCNSSQPHGGQIQRRPIQTHGGDGLAGVLLNRQIQVSTVTPVIEFLVDEFQERKRYATLNTYRSALSATLPQVEGHAVEQHPLVCRLMQGIFNKRPPVPRYGSTWEVDLVLQFIQKKMTSNADLTLKDLSQIGGKQVSRRDPRNNIVHICSMTKYHARRVYM